MSLAQPTRGYLAESSPRYPMWLRVFGGNVVELEEPIGAMAVLPGIGRTHIFKLKVSSLTPGQRAALIDEMSAKWGVSREEVAADIDGAHGCPILAEDVSVTFDPRMLV